MLAPQKKDPDTERLHLLIPLLPASAYRLLLDFLRFDYSFCHYAIPYFKSFGYVTLYLADAKEPYKVEPVRGGCYRRGAVSRCSLANDST